VVENRAANMTCICYVKLQNRHNIQAI
jgi:hypothetical protein